MSEETDALNTEVTAAIWEEAWARVSQAEEQLASLIPPSKPEGRIARRGAIRAALRARDFERAKDLFERYRKEKETNDAIVESLIEVIVKGDWI